MNTNQKWNKVGQWVRLIAVLVAFPLATLAFAPGGSGAKETVFVLFPHPDDEFQAWSLIEGKADEYKVFVSMTRGEGTGHCEPEKFEEGLQADLGEIAPQTTPQGRYSKSCEQARAASLLGFLNQMSQTDPTIPGEFSEQKTYTPTLGPEVDVCRTVAAQDEDISAEDATASEDDTEACGGEALEVQVWLDEEDRGAVVVFNLGDGNLQEGEVEWAINALLLDYETWGLNPGGEVGALISGFSNYGSDRCFRYDHEDHHSVELALWNVDYGVGPQLGATCFRDPRRSLTAIVSEKSVQAAFEKTADGERVGAHVRHYGWLHPDTYPLAQLDRSELFHRVQSFWVKNG